MRIRLLALSATMLLAACASSPSYTDRGPRKAVEREVDGAYVAKVESTARRQGVGVIWVHKPTKEAVARRD